MLFLERLVMLERLVAKLAPTLNSRDGQYIGKVVDVADPLLYGRVKVKLTNQGYTTTLCWKSTEADIELDDTVIVSYIADIGYVTSVVYPRLIERIPLPPGETQPDTVNEQFSSPRMAEPGTPDATPVL